MHSECSSPPTTNYNIANNNGQDGFPNGSYVMSNGKNNNMEERRENSNQLNNLVHDQDISQIVDQVLSCIDQFEDLNDANHSG